MHARAASEVSHPTMSACIVPLLFAERRAGSCASEMCGAASSRSCTLPRRFRTADVLFGVGVGLGAAVSWKAILRGFWPALYAEEPWNERNSAASEAPPNTISIAFWPVAETVTSLQDVKSPSAYSFDTRTSRSCTVAVPCSAEVDPSHPGQIVELQTVLRVTSTKDACEGEHVKVHQKRAKLCQHAGQLFSKPLAIVSWVSNVESWSSEQHTGSS
mmetsp:Transcript_32281/g.76092  ORF Transcript_32281/g.76092 Transcript_32281/m.76092 type:complete len:216 (-) Transcript_32281:501-1148(-)